MTWEAWARRLPIDGAGLKVVSAPPVRHASDAARRADALKAIGYAVLRADADVDEQPRRHWLHRHVALLIDGALTDVGRQWIRDLSLASPRAHLVVSEAPQGEPPAVMRERACDWPETLPSAEGARKTRAVTAAPREARAAALERAGRTTAALSWWRASAAAAARRGDEPAQARALTRYAVTVLRQADPAAVRRLRDRCRAALHTMRTRDARARVVAVMSDAALRLADASVPVIVAWLSGIEVECRLDGVEVPHWITEQQVDAAIWEGRWDEARRGLLALPPSAPSTRGRMALVAWRCRDLAEVVRVEWESRRPAADGVPGGADNGWRELVTLLAAVARHDVPAVLASARLVARDRTVPWGASAAVEALHVAGCRSEALATLERVRRHTSVRSLESMWLVRLSDGLESPVSTPGLACGDVRRDSMMDWGGLSALLEAVNEAEDERDALGLGCRWVRASTGCGHVVVHGIDATVRVSDPDEAGPDEGDVRAPVRQGGVTIGWVSAGGRPRDAAALDGCVRALAAVSAPALRACLDAARLAQSGEALAADLRGTSPAMAALRAAIARAAPTGFPVLIEGESGVGKELVARALHRLSPRRDRTCAAVNCAAFADELFEAEVFGHARGAFTGAIGARAGLFEQAHRGSVFLDEVGELSPRAQAKLLRALQEGEVRRLGETTPRAVDVRIIAATNRPLTAAAASGAFREDLLFRLAVVRLAVPPLRERIEDVPALALAFWAAASRHRETRAWLAPDALAALCRHRWPGNVRELQNVVAGLVLAAPARGRVTARHVAGVLAASPVPGVSLGDARRALDRRLVATALARHAGCRAAAARDLGVSRQGLGKLMARLELPAAGVATEATLR